MLGRVAKPAFANIMLWSVFTRWASMSMWQCVDESQGSKFETTQEPPASGRPSLRGSLPIFLVSGPVAKECQKL